MSRLLWQSGMTKAGDRWSHCGRWYMTKCIECEEEVEPVQISCDLRVCPDCARAFADRMLGRVMPRVDQVWRSRPWGFELRLVTITVRMPGKASWEYVRDAYRMLLGADGVPGAIPLLWRQFLRCKGAGALVGVETAPGGMVHAHVLYFGPWVDQAELSRVCSFWLGSPVVDVRLVDTKARGSFVGSVREVMKYPVKGTEVSPALAVWTLRALKGHRRLRTYGVFYRLPPEEKSEPRACPACGERAGAWPCRAMTDAQARRWFEETVGYAVPQDLS